MTDEDVGADFAHPARVYDYWLGGTDNFPADRAAAEQVLRFMPEILDTVRGNRRFLVRAVGFLRGAGIRQFNGVDPGKDVVVPVVFPGYLLPVDSLEDAAHEGS